jgi:SNF2 family DNA or RNA helicase
MGLGKTVQTIAALRVLAERGELTSSLVVCPAGLIPQWRRALREWAPTLRLSTVQGGAADRAWQWNVPASVHLVSYETLRSDSGSAVSPPRRRVWDVVVLDEAQRIKNADADTARVCKRIPRTRAWALTGTPLENRIEDLASILEFVRAAPDGEPGPRIRVGNDLLDLHRRLQLRRRKVDVLDQLPPKTFTTLDLELSGAQRAAYDKAEQEGVIQLKALGPEVRISNVLELITRLKQLCNVDPGSGQSAKLDDLFERIGTLTEQGHRALVFSQFTTQEHGVGLIANRLQQFNPLTYTGGMDTDARDRVIQRFLNDERHRVLVLSLRAGGQGLNLQQASYVFHFDRWWNPAVERQAEDRSHRMGQTVPVTVYAYRCVKTVEQRIDEVLNKKQHMFDAVVDSVSMDVDQTLTKQELLGLFDLEAPS